MRRALALAGRHFRWIAALATAVGIAVALLGQRRAIAEFDWSLSWPLVLASVACFAAAPLVQGFSFWLMLRFLGIGARPSDAMLIWSRSFLLRYAPSGALAIVIRVRERDRLTASRGEIYLVTAYEQVVALLAGAIAAVACFALAGGPPHWIVLAIGLPVLAVAILVRPAFAGRWLHALLARRGLEMRGLLRGRQLAAAVAVNVVSWLATGAGVYVLVGGMSEGGRADFAWLTAVYATGWLVGFVVPALPGGLGARDGVLVALLATRYGAGVASALGIAVRLANTLGELVAIGLVEAVYALRRRLGGRAPLVWAEVRRATSGRPRDA